MTSAPLLQRLLPQYDSLQKIQQQHYAPQGISKRTRLLRTSNV